MKKNTAVDIEYGATLAKDRQPENRCRMHVDAQGYAIHTRGWYGMEFLKPDDPTDFKAFIRSGLNAYPLPTADIVLPTGWTWVVVGDELVAVLASEWEQEQQALTARAA